ncbi:unnamed protein product [Cuscuta epithymum]|uniref:Uncharacterized protein n=1 Tax=Cuscuta epithymum TaxID=186058 RepID=A0AAV0E7Z5_9ASTE|nr:unnamed protein product [Cuscuta epithymum]
MMMKNGAVSGSDKNGHRQPGGDYQPAPASLKSKIITHENNTLSRRFSSSHHHVTTFREEEADNKNYTTKSSVRSNIINISSTVSSPGFTSSKEEIDPSTYSFSTALKALQGKTAGGGYGRWWAEYYWKTAAAEGLSLNSKWNEAEKYICNPLSGEVPLECLSAKTLSGRSFRQQLATRRSRISMSAPLFYPPRLKKPPHVPPHLRRLDSDQSTTVPSQEKSSSENTRDVGTQSSCGSSCTPPPPYPLSSSSSPNPSVQDKWNHITREPPPSDYTIRTEVDSLVEAEEAKVKTKDGEEEEITPYNESREKGKQEKEKGGEIGKIQRGCLSLIRFLSMRKRQRRKEKHRPRKKKNSRHIFLCPVHAW